MLRSEEAAAAAEDGRNKRKRRQRSNNPLAQARGKQNKHENIWFRRSGIGYSLFVQYYTGQPAGVVCDNRSPKDERATNAQIDRMLLRPPSSLTSAGSVSAVPPSQTQRLKQQRGRGMSRAAKKRRKKKSKWPASSSSAPQQSLKNKHDTNDPTSDRSTSVSMAAPPSAATGDIQSVLQHDKRPLIKAWNDCCIFANQRKIPVTSCLPFFLTLAEPLPLTLRIRRSLVTRQQYDDVVASLRDQESRLFERLPWSDASYSEVYQSSTIDKTTLSNNYPKLHERIVRWSESGVLARQEIGSMLPVIVLYELSKASPSFGLRPGSNVLDMCASPGSKTLQALEIVCDTDKTKRGRIVANDILQSRLETLRQAIQRSGVPSKLAQRITYSCQDASKMNVPTTASTKNGKQRPLHWDVVICDVPCSGDGTIRKDKHILPMWKPQIGNELHSTQLRILLRALELVAVGGVVCYSTCSLNPVEDEAVVAAALGKLNSPSKPCHSETDNADGKERSSVVELVDIPKLDGFKRRPGVSTWKVADYDDDCTSSSSYVSTTETIVSNGPVLVSSSRDVQARDYSEEHNESARLTWYGTWEETRATKSSSLTSPKTRPKLPKTLWPCRSSDDDSKSLTVYGPEQMRLDRCTRLWPHDYNTGGFFLAVFRKLRPCR